MNARQRLVHAEREGIRYLGYVRQALWPDSHSKLLSDIQTLGDKSDLEYSADVTIDSIEKPWRAENVHRARELAALAKKIGNEHRNEPGWRLNIEHIVLYRFTVEVTCTRCRARLWRSEIEAAHDSLYRGDLSDQAATLERRRQRRDPCQCPGDLHGWSDDQYDRGINMIFSDRADEAINHSASTTPGKTDKEKPDRVIGLTETENIRMLLNSHDSRTPLGECWKRLRDTLKVTPFAEEANRLLFPFLIIEAKSGRSGVDFHAIAAQTMLCIKDLLQLQMDLRTATEKETFEPLVWFIGYAGQFWHVSACFVHMTRSAEVRMITVWQGDICRDDQALQLVLIIDYIFDWARDIYRPLILNQLGTLSDEEAIFPDPDIFSTIEGRESTWIGGSQDTQNEVRESLSRPSFPDILPWELVLVPHGVIRDASIIETRLTGLLITEHDVEEFLLSFPLEEAAQSAMSVLLGCLKDSWRVTGRTLVALEAEWAEEPASDPLNLMFDESFYFKITVQMFVGVEWEPVRQLTYLAVSECAVSNFLDRVAFNADIHHQTENSSVTEKRIIHRIQQLKQQSVVDNLTAVMSMVSFSNTTNLRGNGLRTRRRLKKSGWRNDNSHVVVDFVTKIYEAHKIGRRRPTDRYLRFSCIRSQQTIRFSGTRVWPYLAPIQLDQNGCILIDGMNTSSNVAKRCLYIVKGNYEKEQAATLVQNASERGLYYTTMQRGPGTRPEGYVNFLNRTTVAADGYWMDKRLSEEVGEWLREVRKRTSQGTAPEPLEGCPIVISSDEETSQTDVAMESD